MNNDQFWDQFLNIINSKLNSISFNTWFKDAKLVKFTDNTLTIDVGSKYKKDYISKFYDDLLEETISSITGREYNIEVVTPMK